MPDSSRYYRKISFQILSVLVGTVVLFIANQGFAQQTGELQGQALYNALKTFELQAKVTVSNLKLKRDLGEMTFTGDFYFATPINGQVTGAVFIGKGTFHAKAIETEFKTAVLRFTDDTYDIIGKNSIPAAKLPGKALDLAKELEPRLLKETSANISARLAISIANNESPGFFMAQFNKGKLGRFTFLIDPQCRILNDIFRFDGGEKVAVFSYAPYQYNNDLRIITHSKQDYANESISYPSDFDLVDPKHYKMEIDLRKATRKIRTNIRIDYISLVDNLRAIPMIINDAITAFDNKRLKNSMRVESARYNGQDILCIQEDWESGLTFLLPKPMSKGEAFSIEVSMTGDVMEDDPLYQDIKYHQGDSSWYPRHGFIRRSTFDLTFRHNKEDKVASVGTLAREEEWPDDNSDRLSQYKMDTPIVFASFITGIMDHHSKKRMFEFGEMEINYYSLPTALLLLQIDEEFILTELGNALEYFSNRFGPYPYKDFQAAFSPRLYRQVAATFVIHPGLDISERYTFSYIGETISRQWWGTIITVRSYRDQWLLEGLAEYSGLLYVLARLQDIREQKEFIDVMRYGLKEPLKTDTGIRQGKVSEIGPLIKGRLLQSRDSLKSSKMITDKGALVIRMLHFLFSDPSTGNDSLFFEMLKDFASQYAFTIASTDDFRLIADKHFPKTNIAKRFGLENLHWFFRQWLYEARLPSYRMEYRIEPGTGGQFLLTGEIIQENAPEHWMMPLPVIITYPNNQQTQVVVWARGSKTEIQLPPLPMKPDSVELDPDWWILSEKTETKKK